MEAGPTVDEPEFVENKPDYWYDASKPFYDLYTGLVLPTEGVMKARADEIAFMDQLKVWDIVQRQNVTRLKA